MAADFQDILAQVSDEDARWPHEKIAAEIFPLAIIGAGLMGSSVLRAARAKFPSADIRITDKSAIIRDRANDAELTTVCETLKDTLFGAKTVLIAVPVGAYEAVADDIRPFLARDTLVTDLGSVKRAVQKTLECKLPHVERIVMSHPVAGTELSGPEAGRHDLFENRWVILTPSVDSDVTYVTRLAQFWRALGGHIEIMDAAHHDRVLAITSHIPHLVAYNIVGTASDLETVTQSEVIKYSAGGFRDFTRIAASDPTMWRDIFLGNKDATLEMLERFIEDLTALKRAIRWDDGETLFATFNNARDIRKKIIDAGQETRAPDFGRNQND